ncbi:hypothetical protein [Hymenobacter setariae]|nr:hypothetical protein [Hymenobacter setariae]
MSYSAKIILQKPAKQNGTYLRRLQPITNRVLYPIRLNSSWWP